MLDAMSAESLKLRRHRATWLLVWVFPIGAFIFPLLAILIQLAQGSPPAPGAPLVSAWIENATNFWALPRGGLGRILVSAYIAIVFAGEYGWNTWKLIVPHRSRGSLIAAKFAVSFLLLYLAFTIAALLVTGLGWLEDIATGDPVPAGITFGALALAHLQELAASLPAILFTMAVAALAAILTRSTAAALVIGIVVITIEQLFTNFGPALSLYLPGPVETLYNALPGYHFGNLTGWLLEGQGRIVPFPNGTNIAWSLEGSLAVVGAWVLVLTGLTFWRFGRQDIN